MLEPQACNFIKVALPPSMIESPLKMMNNAFQFILKAHFVLKRFKFLSRLSGHVGKRLDQKCKVNLKIHDVTTWFTIAKLILPNISKVKVTRE